MGHVGHSHAGHSHVNHSHAGHNHGHGHSHAGHGHSHAPASYNKAFAVGIGLNLAFVAVEVVYGLRAGSLALVADAGHNLGDVLGLVLAWVAAVLATRLPTQRRTYGLRRSSILAALGNSIFLLVTGGAIAWDAIGRLREPSSVATGTVIWVAAVGIAINTATALFFMSGRKGDINIRAAFLHMVSDAAVSAGVVVAAIVIAATGWLWLDPAMSLVIVAIITVGTWGLLRESLNLALDAVPVSVDVHIVERYLRALPGVTEVHDLHIWGMSTTEVALTAHLVKPVLDDDDTLLITVCKELRDHHGIEHATFQIERGHGPHSCELAPANVI